MEHNSIPLNVAQKLAFKNQVFSLQCARIAPNCVIEKPGEKGPISLRELAGENGIGDIDLVINIAAGIVELLIKIHQVIIAHAHITPDTIFWDPATCQAKISDFRFALSRENSPSMAEMRLMSKDDLIFAAPELKTTTDWTPTFADQYSLGMTLLFALYGYISPEIRQMLAFADANESNEGSKRKTQAFCSILEVLTSDSPSKRYSSEFALLKDIIRCKDIVEGPEGEVKFELSHFQIDDSQIRNLRSHLYGREHILDDLCSIISIVDDSSFIVLSGEAGVGKTALINALHHKIATNAFVCKTKPNLTLNYLFDTLNIHFGDIYQDWDAKLKKKLEMYDADIMNIAFRSIKGSPTVPKMLLDITQVVQQQKTVIKAQVDFLKLCAEVCETPIVIIIDDVHQADAAVISFLLALAKDAETIPSLSVVLTFQSNTDIVLSSVFQDMLKSTPVLIDIPELQEKDVRALVSDIFQITDTSTSTDLDKLASLIMEKVGGNPRSIHSLLENVVSFHATHASRTDTWHFDFEGISKSEMANPAVEAKLMMREIQKNGEVVNRLCQLCACLGESFSLVDISRIVSCGRGEIKIPYIDSENINCLKPLATVPNDVSAAELIVPALNAGAIVVNPALGLCFANSSIQSAFIQSYEDIAEMRLVLGCVFLDCAERSGNTAKQFIAVGAEAVAKAGSEVLVVEVTRLIVSNMKLCLRRLDLDNAKRYGVYAKEFISSIKDHWKKYLSLSYTCFLLSANVDTLCGDYASAEAVYSTLAELEGLTMDQRLDVFDSYAALDQLAGNLGKLWMRSEESIKILGLQPYPESQDEIMSEMEKLRDQVLEQLDELWKAKDEWEVSTDPKELREGYCLLNHVVGMFFDPTRLLYAWAWSALRGLLVALSKKIYVSTLPATIVVAAVAFGIWDKRLSFRMGKFAMSLLRRDLVSHSNLNPLIQQITMHVVGRFTKHAHDPFSDIDAIFRMAVGIGENGTYGAQMVWRSFSSFDLIRNMINAGTDLRIVQKQANKINDDILTYAEGFQRAFYKPSGLQIVNHLVGATNGPSTLSSDRDDFDEAKYIETFKPMPYIFVHFIHAKLITLFWGGAVKDGLEWVEYLPYVTGGEELTNLGTMSIFYSALILLANANANEDLLDRAEELCNRLRPWAEVAPSNYLCMYLVVAGELARLRGNETKAIRFLKEAVVSASKHNLIYVEALACEYLGHMCSTPIPTDDDAILQSLDDDFDNTALYSNTMLENRDSYFRRCLVLYEQWGATVRLQYLQTLDSFKMPSIATSESIDTASSKSKTPEQIHLPLNVPFLQLEGNSLSSEAFNTYMLKHIDVGLSVSNMSDTVSLVRDLIHDHHSKHGNGREKGDWRQYLLSHWDAKFGSLLTDSVATLYENKAYRKLSKLHRFTTPTVFVTMLWHFIQDDRDFTIYSNVEEHSISFRLHYWVKEEKDGTFLVFHSASVVDGASSSAGKQKVIEKQILDLELMQQEKIDALREAEETQRHLADEAKFYEQQQARFSSTLAHELRNPLNGIIAGIELVQASMPQESESGNDLIDTVSDIAKCATHLRLIVDDVLDLAKLNANEIQLVNEPLHPYELIRTVLSMFRSAINARRIDVVESYGEGITPEFNILGDWSRLTQVVTNLVSNAIKFTPANGCGKITVSLQLMKKDNIFAIRVGDNGIGMSEKTVKEDLFKPFRQSRTSTPADTTWGGTGLGLAITHTLVSKMDGALSVESVEGEGSTFTVALPYLPSEATPTTSTPPLRIDHGASSKYIPGIRILCVDDVSINLRILKGLLKLLGCSPPMTAANGLEAYETFRDNNGEFDIILMDIEMPEMNGYESSQKIREWERDSSSRRKPVPIIALSGYVSDHHKKRADIVGMTGYLTKPITGEALKAVLIEHCVKK